MNKSLKSNQKLNSPLAEAPQEMLKRVFLVAELVASSKAMKDKADNCQLFYLKREKRRNEIL